MIEFSVEGLKGKINEDFILEMPNGDLKELLKKHIEVFLAGFRPQDGDPFLVFAERLSDIGIKVIKAEEMKDAENTVF